MKPMEFDKSLATALKTMREIKVAKQLNLAEKISLTEASYSRIENGEWPLTGGRIEIVCDCLKILPSEIMLMASFIKNTSLEKQDEKSLLALYDELLTKSNMRSGLSEKDLIDFMAKLIKSQKAAKKRKNLHAT